MEGRGLQREMGKFSQVFSFPDNNLSTYQWIFTKLDICIDIVDVLFWNANGQIT